ncbi:hypothetical protein [Mycoplasmopsis edwardii]|uniref:Uncharacterized protein n=1 Tax=Mycoplasmopsis edwardii TaxID=53558 RepID=A0ACD4PJL8_9BACT|nr:hypothetical protein [Mycoplasmopsis edwardii]WBP83876.1 hypothetical protein Me_995_000502 [Mycoplasmopsis edwardii]
MNETLLKETFYRLAKNELAAKGIDDSAQIEALMKKYYDEINNVRNSNIKDDRAKKLVDKPIELQ